VIALAVFLASAGVVLVGFPTCDTEHGTCPTWHETLNLVGAVGAGVSLLIVLILGLIVITDAAFRQHQRVRR
jgi:hypothetical protein